MNDLILDVAATVFVSFLLGACIVSLMPDDLDVVTLIGTNPEVETFCNADYCINSTPLHFDFCEEQGYLHGVSGREWSGFYSSDPDVVDGCREIWKFLADSRGDGSEE